MIKKQRIGFFGGSFDPPHNGHIALVCACIENLQLDMVYIVPSKINPLKSTTKTAAGIRLQLTQLAFQNVPKTKVLDCELNRKEVSFTVDSVVWLIENDLAFREAKRFLLLGDDLLAQMNQWKEPKKLFELAQPIVGKRCADIDTKEIGNCMVLDSPRFEISSTEVRQRITKGLFSGHLVPEAVLAFIHKNKLYQE